MRMVTEPFLDRSDSSAVLSQGQSQRIALESASGALPGDTVLTAAYRSVRRLVEVVLVALIAPAAIVILAVCAAAILLLMGRPVLFVQDRVGRDGKVFRMLKLRTMVDSPSSGSVATAENDPRITPLGGFLRRFHFDELPQLWNILVGDMSFIGPRPEQPKLVAYYRSQIPHYDLRHVVTPGLTGWSQVYFGYAANLQETRTKLEYDLYFIQNFGFILDIRILFRTIWVYANPLYVR